MDDEVKQILQDFLIDAQEGLKTIETDFVELEKDPTNQEILNGIFRFVHSMKGAASFMGLTNLGGIAHKGESVMDKLRKGDLALNTGIMDTIFLLIDVIRALISELANKETDTETDTTYVGSLLDKILAGETVSLNEQPAWIEAENTPEPTPGMEDVNPDPIVQPVQKEIIAAQPAQGEKPVERRDLSQNIRIDVPKLDYIIDLVGELVLSRNRNLQLQKILSKKYSADETVTIDLQGAGNNLDSLTSELQLAIMKLRMVPVSTVLNKFSRVVRDIANKVGKKVDFKINGGDTEIDKNIVEGISDPLTHIIRNSVDHGIEAPDERVLNGKAEAGQIEMSAYYEGNYVIIEVSDNGKGIDPDRIKSKAIEKGVITNEEAGKMSKAAILDLIFAPGFSTMEQVTDLSGRGVGMDVVKTNIEKLKGHIILDSEKGKGTNLKLKMPLTLAILDTLVVNVSEQKYAIPLADVEEAHRMKFKDLEHTRGHKVFRMRDEILPVETLTEIVKLPYHYHQDTDITVIVLRRNGVKMGIVVDNITGHEEVLIKSLECLDGLAEPQGVSGASILGDGSIIFIIDVDAIMKITCAAEKQAENISKASVTQSIVTETFVLFDNNGREQYAVPACNIEEILIVNRGEIETLAGAMFTKYRGKSLQITTISSVAGTVCDDNNFEDYYLLIIKHGGILTGLITYKLHGIRKYPIDSILPCGESSVSGTTGHIISNDKRFIFLLSPEAISSSIHSSNTLAPVSISAGSSGSGKVLVIDDTKMYRTLLSDVVRECGFTPITAEDGADGLNKLTGDISLVLTDLEMPRMDGYEFTSAARRVYPDKPIVVVTTRSGDADKKKGFDVGVTDYMVKFDKELLRGAIDKYMGSQKKAA